VNTAIRTDDLIAHRRSGIERGRHMTTIWWVLGVTVLAVVTWAIGSTLLLWITLD
jgi:hypothetical protein